MARQRILVTGAAGTVGRALLAQLVADPTRPEVIALDQDTPKARKALAPFADQARCVFADITDEAILAGACAGVDIALHLAALIPPAADAQPELTRRINLGGTDALIAALREHAPNSMLVYASSVAVYGDRLATPDIRVGDPLSPSPGDHYAESKLAAEQAVQASGLDWVIFRLAAVWGGHGISPLMFHMPLETQVEFISASDAARAFAHAASARDDLMGKIFNLGGGPACRSDFRSFLTRSFTLAGLGRADFPEGTFARRGFHCGFYADGDALENILLFRHDTLQEFFTDFSRLWPWWKRLPVILLRRPIKAWLLRQSEPYRALKTGNTQAITRSFGADVPKV